MDPLDRLVPYWAAFMRLPFLVRRTIYVALFLLCFAIGAKTYPGYHDVGFTFLMISWFGVVWSTGLWRLWKPLAIALAIYLRIFY